MASLPAFTLGTDTVVEQEERAMEAYTMQQIAEQNMGRTLPPFAGGEFPALVPDLSMHHTIQMTNTWRKFRYYASRNLFTQALNECFDVNGVYGTLDRQWWVGLGQVTAGLAFQMASLGGTGAFPPQSLSSQLNSMIGVFVNTWTSAHTGQSWTVMNTSRFYFGKFSNDPAADYCKIVCILDLGDLSQFKSAVTNFMIDDALHGGMLLWNFMEKTATHELGSLLTSFHAAIVKRAFGIPVAVDAGATATELKEMLSARLASP